ncbi:hypothetical protein [Streptomyces sp. H51]|uniref:hypothetical protein n=1 Tax=Streptomyces sp. H51 TaxID=3111770 RepID=UPI002D7947C0|nr:hypothetical protein [Streptomyces sp. H51]
MSDTDNAWGLAVLNVVYRLAPALVMETDRGRLSLDTATDILQATSGGAVTGIEEFLAGCLSDVMDYRLDGTVPEAAPEIPQEDSREDPCPEATDMALSDLAWELVPAVDLGKLPLETAVFLYAMAAEVHKNEAEEAVSFVMAEYLTAELE